MDEPLRKFIDPAEHRFAKRHVVFWAAAPPGARQELVAADPEQFFAPAFGGYDWIGMRLDARSGGPDWVEVREVLTDAYRLVAPKRLIAKL